jgi:hypothetical protein
MLRPEHLLVQQLQRVRVGPVVDAEAAARLRRRRRQEPQRLLVDANHVAVHSRCRGRCRGGEGHELMAGGGGGGGVCSDRGVDEEPVDPGATGGGGG